MNVKALVLAAVTIGVAVVTLVALNLIAPISHASESQTIANGITADQVFSASISESGDSSPAPQPMEVAALADTAAPAMEAAAPPPEAASEAAAAEVTSPAAAPTSPAPGAPAVAGGSCSMEASDGPPVVVPAAGTSAASAVSAPEMEVAQATPAPETVPAPAPAPEPAPAEPMMDAGAAASPPPASSAPAEAAGACATGLADPNQQPVVVKAGGYPGDTSAPPAPTDMAIAPEGGIPESAAPMESAPAPTAAEPPPPAPAPEPAPAPKPAAAAPAPAPAAAPAAPAPAPAAAPPPTAPEPKVEAPKPKPKPKPKAEAPAKPAEPKPAEPKPAKATAPKTAPAEAKLAWWPAKTAGKLNVVYAGEASFTKAIAIMLDGQFDNADSANQNIKVTPKKGGDVKGKWLVAKGNPSMLLLDVAPGLYTVEVGSGLADKSGRAIGAGSSGAVFVH